MHVGAILRCVKYYKLEGHTVIALYIMYFDTDCGDPISMLFFLREFINRFIACILSARYF